MKSIKVYDGNIHHRIGGYFIDLTFALLGVIALIWTRDMAILSRLGLIYFGARLGNNAISPDLDLGKSRPLSQWGSLRWIWLPYSSLIKHRSIWSHGIVVPIKWRKSLWKSTMFKMFGSLIGTMVRALYLTFIILSISFLLDWIIGFRFLSFWTPQLILTQYTLYLFLGLALSDWIHTRFDMLTTKVRK